MSAIAWDLYPKDVFRWVSFGTTATPSTATTIRHPWSAYGLSAFNDVFVWDSRGTSTTPAATTDTHDGGRKRRLRDAKYGDQIEAEIARNSAVAEARRVALEQAISTVLPQPVEEAVAPSVAAQPAARVPLQKSKGIAPTGPDAIDLRLKQMEEDEQFVIFIATQLH